MFLPPYPRTHTTARPLAATTNTHVTVHSSVKDRPATRPDKLDKLKHDRHDKRARSPARSRHAFPSKAISAAAEKAKPTVCVTSTNASRAGDSVGEGVCTVRTRIGSSRRVKLAPPSPTASAVPFPSAPIPFPTSRERTDDAMDWQPECAPAPSPLAMPTTWPHRPPVPLAPTLTTALTYTDSDPDRHIPQKRARASLSFPPLSEDRSTLRGSPVPQAKPTPRPDIPAARRPRLSSASPSISPCSPAQDLHELVPRSHGAAGRCGSISAGSPTPIPASTPPVKRARKGRKATSDLQFNARMHRSIVCHALSSPAHSGEGEGDVLADQDALLVERLWGGLLGQGCTPVPLPSSPSDVAVASTGTPPTSSPHQEDAGPGETLHTDCVPPSSSQLAHPLDVLTMPQLVAALIMRHRGTGRARGGRSRAVDEDKRKRSSLAMLLCSADEDLREA
ncbi:hypothetical protein CERSUDRAFT_125423 [Gelatoporia subvermispora B]|uniref:Uncharacterized protein n=1 Tax=Ceriporiopsis subvermispora (strain B) TaxID=914234 RepID=M2PEB7_CERS8|nr:hypothetical protein CERSUDRAFT_125423 [Gelatoporia subvermispora B]